MRNLGGAIGIAGCATILNDRTNLHFLRLAEHLNATNQAMNGCWPDHGGQSPISGGDDPSDATGGSLRQLWPLTMREAQTLTYADAFLVHHACCFVVATRWCR